MGKKSIGVAMLLLGIVMIACGWYLRKKFHAEASYRGIGSFRFTPGGFAWFVGYLLFIFGLSAVLVSFMLIFL